MPDPTYRGTGGLVFVEPAPNPNPPEKLPPRNTMTEATFFWKSTPGIEGPNIQVCQAEVLKTSRENAT